MIVVVSDRNQLSQGRNSTFVVAMPMRDNAVIDLFQTGQFNRDVRDSAGIAIAGKSSVDQQRLTSRRNDQGCSAAFDVDEIDIESPGSGPGVDRRAEYRE
jgi:hypothetical protein